MKRESRTALSKLNVISSIAGRIIGMICTFAGRGIFVRTLRTEYLGLGGFFGNIFSVISLCELGVGAAIAQSLYKPLAENDENKVSGIVAYYQKINNIIGCVTLVLSLCSDTAENSENRHRNVRDLLLLCAFFGSYGTVLCDVRQKKSCYLRPETVCGDGSQRGGERCTACASICCADGVGKLCCLSRYKDTDTDSA